MKFIFDFIKGMFIGVANIIPGVSGGTMAVSMGIHDKLVNALNNLTKKFKKSFVTLLPIIIGMAAGIGLFSFIIPHCLENYAFQTCMCFTGLIIGGIPELVGSTRTSFKKENKKLGPFHILAFAIFLAIALWMAFANPASSGADTISVSFKNIVIMVALGIIASATMVVPGISGSLILMMLGYYSGVVGSVKDFIVAIKELDKTGILHGIEILIPFAIGCILGILLISKLISFLFRKCESVTLCGILGLVIASPVAIFAKMENASFNAVSIIIGIILLIAGTALTYFLGKNTKETDKTTEA